MYWSINFSFKYFLLIGAHKNHHTSAKNFIKISNSVSYNINTFETLVFFFSFYLLVPLLRKKYKISVCSMGPEECLKVFRIQYET